MSKKRGATLGYVHKCQILGRGDFRLGNITWDAVMVRLLEACAKHPHFAEGRDEARDVIAEEMREFTYAVEHESEARQIDEVLDVIATCLRFLRKDHELEHNPKCGETAHVQAQAV